MTNVIHLIQGVCLLSLAWDVWAIYDPMEFHHLTEEDKDPSKYGMGCVHGDIESWSSYGCPSMPKLRRNWLVWGCCKRAPAEQPLCKKDDDESAGEIPWASGKYHCLRCHKDEGACTEDKLRCWHDDGFDPRPVEDNECHDQRWVGRGMIGGAARPGVPDSDLTYQTLCLACHQMDEDIKACKTGWQQLCLKALHDLNKPRCENTCTVKRCTQICANNSLDYAGMPMSAIEEGADASYYEPNACTWSDRCVAKCRARSGAGQWDVSSGIEIDDANLRGYTFLAMEDKESCGYDIGNPCVAQEGKVGMQEDQEGKIINITYDLRLFCPRWNAGSRARPPWHVLFIVLLAASSLIAPAGSVSTRTEHLSRARSRWSADVLASMCLLLVLFGFAACTTEASPLLLRPSLVPASNQSRRLRLAPGYVLRAELLTEMPISGATSSRGQTCGVSEGLSVPLMAHDFDSGLVGLAVGEELKIMTIYQFDFRIHSTVSFSAPVKDLAAAPPRLIAAALDNGNVSLVNLFESSSVATLPVSREGIPVRAVASCPHEIGSGSTTRYLVTSGERIQLWRVSGNDTISTQLLVDDVLVGDFPIRTFICADIPSVKKRFVAAGVGLDIWIWHWELSDVLTSFGSPLRLTGHGRSVGALAFLPQAKLLSSGTDGGYLGLWDIIPLLTGEKDTSEITDLFTVFRAHDEAIRSLSVSGEIAEVEAVISGSSNGEIKFWKPITGLSCGFKKEVRKYLEGWNTVVMLQTDLNACLKQCCATEWCLSADYQHSKDMSHGGGTAGSRCLLSTSSETLGASTLVSDPSFDYYELTRRGGLILHLPLDHSSATSGIIDLGGRLLTRSRDEVRMWLNVATRCPDGQTPNHEGTSCIPCRIGSAGGSGRCDQCERGKHQDVEGKTACISCGSGKYASDRGQASCYTCPQWTLIGGEGLISCPWCPAGQFPNPDRKGCVAFQKGPEWQPDSAWKLCKPHRLVALVIAAFTVVLPL